MLPCNLLDDAVRFHGHLGPFLVLGLRAGMIGVRYLGKDYFELKASVETSPVPPRSCFIDGVQFSSGCTTGKGNIVITVGENVSVLFERKGRKVLVRVNPQFLGSLKNLGSEEELEGLSRDLMDRTDDDLFLIQEM